MQANNTLSKYSRNTQHTFLHTNHRAMNGMFSAQLKSISLGCPLITCILCASCHWMCLVRFGVVLILSDAKQCVDGTSSNQNVINDRATSNYLVNLDGDNRLYLFHSTVVLIFFIVIYLSTIVSIVFQWRFFFWKTIDGLLGNLFGVIEKLWIRTQVGRWTRRWNIKFVNCRSRYADWTSETITFPCMKFDGDSSRTNAIYWHRIEYANR